jgi:DNA (cytosine-5)-methyltransferase 1
MNAIKTARKNPLELKNRRGNDFLTLTCADLFAGGGGFSKAALEVNIHVKCAVELDRHACETYRQNLIAARDPLNVPTLFEGDIQVLELDRLSACFTQGQGCDIVLGGPPCQGFSVHRINDAGVADPRNNLIHSYFRVVRHLKPKVFLLENVPGLLWERHADYLNLFYQEAEAAGYKVQKPAILDARDYGVPQRRKRVFILGISKDLDGVPNWPPPQTHGSVSAIEANPLLLQWEAARSAFKKAPAGDPNDLHMRHSMELTETFRRTPANGGSRKDSGRLLPCHIAHDGHKDVYGRINPEHPGPTMTTACVNPSKGRFVHPTKNHGITLREAARLQTFPDDYIFHGGIIAASRQIGNAVPVELAKAILKSISAYLIKVR